MQRHSLLSFYVFKTCCIVGFLLTSSCEFQHKEPSPKDVYEEFFEIIEEQYVCFAEHSLDWDSLYSYYGVSVSNMRYAEQLYPIFDNILTALQDYHISIEHKDTVLELQLLGIPNIPTGPIQVCPDYYTFNLINKGNIRYSSLLTNEHNNCYAYLGILSFQKDVKGDLMSAIEELSDQSPIGWIIDLRGNKGGYMSVVEDLVSQFITGRRLLYSTYKRSNKTDRYLLHKVEDINAIGTGLVSCNTPIVVIVDETTYSAANVCAYIFRTMHNALIIGEQATAGGGAGKKRSRLAKHWTLDAPTDIKIYVEEESTEVSLSPQIFCKPSDEPSTNVCISMAIKNINYYYLHSEFSK